MKYLKYMIFVLGLLTSSHVLANKQDWVDERVQQEQKQIKNPFLVSLHKPTYVMPFYYSTSPDQAFYNAVPSPANQKIQRTEFNFQVSFKVPLWRNIFNDKSALYAAYTQQSFWQAYNSSAFFRASNYEPEIFFGYNLDKPLFGDWRAKIINFGFVHQSNGQGGLLERTWNRVYAEGILANPNWTARIKIWTPIRDGGLKKYNPDIARFLGYGELQIAYKTAKKHVFSIESRNGIESGFKRAATYATWSFPILENIKGYVQIFNGYGQNLNEYNYRNNSVGVGVALNDWI